MKQQLQHSNFVPRGGGTVKIEIGSKAWQLGITTNVLNSAVDVIGMPTSEVDGWLQYMEENDFTFTTGGKVN